MNDITDVTEQKRLNDARERGKPEQSPLDDGRARFTTRGQSTTAASHHSFFPGRLRPSYKLVSEADYG